MTIPATTTPAKVDLEALDGYVAELELAEAELAARGVPIDAIIQRACVRPDGVFDFQWLARLAVVGALQVATHLGDHRDGPWWEALT